MRLLLAIIKKYMDQNKAIEILIQAAELAQKKGVFSLQDAALVFTAINFFKAPEPKVGDIAPEVSEPVEEVKQSF